MTTLWIRSLGTAMDQVTKDCGALAEAVVFLNHFNDMPDRDNAVRSCIHLPKCCCWRCSRVGRSRILRRYRPVRSHEARLLRRFRPFLDGTPSHDHLGDIFAALDAEQFQRCFVAWTASLIGVPEAWWRLTARPCAAPAERPVKRHPYGLRLRREPAPRARQVKVAEKSNEIVAIPKLLDMLAVEGAIITIDAMGANARSRRKSSIRRPIMSSA